MRRSFFSPGNSSRKKKGDLGGRESAKEERGSEVARLRMAAAEYVPGTRRREEWEEGEGGGARMCGGPAAKSLNLSGCAS